MKILVVSDSHGYLRRLNRVIDSFGDSISAVIHLGDGCEDLNEFKKKDNKTDFYRVVGNCDSHLDLPSKIVTSIGGKKFLCVHGHRYGVKNSYDRIFNVASKERVDIFLFGHTHIPTLFYYDNTVFFNPGSISIPSKSYLPSFGIIEITDDGVIRPSAFSIKNKSFIDLPLKQDVRYF